MDTQTVTLKCPSCGNTNNAKSKELKYGFQFTCEHCQTTSVLIVNKELYLPRPGERVCLNCGRVSSGDTRFCQCGAALFRKCVNLQCQKEIPIDHLVCDYCGWRQEINPGSEIGMFERLKRYLNSSETDVNELQKLLREMQKMGPAASQASPVLSQILSGTSDKNIVKEICITLNAIEADKPSVIAGLIKLLECRDTVLVDFACRSLRSYGSIAKDAIPTLTWFINPPNVSSAIALGTINAIDPNNAKKIAETLAEKLIEQIKMNQVKWEIALPIIRAMESVDFGAASKVRETSIQKFVEMLSSVGKRYYPEIQDQVEQALSGLGYLNASEAIPAILDALSRYASSSYLTEDEVMSFWKFGEVLRGFGPGGVPIIIPRLLSVHAKVVR